MKHFEGFNQTLNQKLIDDTIELGGRDPIDKLIPSETTKPISTTRDARQEDLETVIIQQNILYTVATLTAATFLITSIVLANGR